MVVTLKVGFIGCGQVNFGGGEGPWDHATRMESFNEKYKSEYFLHIVGVSDPFVQRAKQVVEIRQNKKSNELQKKMWQDTKIYENYEVMLKELQVDCVFIGVPPEAHGCTYTSKDIELECIKRGVHMFIEKPISCYPIQEVEKIGQSLSQVPNLVVSVGYMFRYSAAIQKIKQIIAQYGPVKAFNARYNCAYSTLSKDMWWDVDRSGGPIVEQATHFCDLARYLVGSEINLNSVKSISIKQTDKGGQLGFIPSNIKEETLSPEKRIPRVTNAFWKFENGAIGNLMHGALLHEIKYEAELELWGDGYRIVLIEPYGNCKVAIRFPHQEHHEFFEFKNDDPYFNEVEAFIFAIVKKGEYIKGIQSTYLDAIETYKLTWKIRQSAEENTF